jgi:two-component system chemotaxis response regulator CheY
MTSSKWVLVVDDDEDNRESMIDLLKEGGYMARGASGGEDALAILQSERPSLVLVDFKMGDMDGHELLIRARELLDDKAPQFVFVTGADPSELGEVSGAILFKPLDVDQLFGVVAHHCA